MRTIKFRAWDEKEKEMWTWDEHNRLSHTDNEMETTVPLDEFIGSSGVILMQFTGLKDSKGVEIYEGDVVSFRLSGEDRIEEVVWEEDCFHASQYKHEEWRTEWNKMEVIGNVHENPELLK